MSPSSAERMAAASPTQDPSLFVINLCASTTPMALVHPGNPELKRYTFFVTRQREEGRERFRLHMGYFASLFEAETLLVAVRDVYPAAWAGPAPTQGAPRRGRVAVAAAPVAEPVAELAVAAKPAAAPAPEPAPAPAPAPRDVPELALVAEPPPAPAAPPVLSVVPEPVREPVSTPVVDAMSNLRDVLAQLGDDEGPTRIMPAPTRIPTLSESQTLRILEKPTARPAPKARAVAIAQDDEVRLVTPEDTQTLRDIKLDAERNAPPCFAVQLLWSVTPISITDHPHLAIFDAYTLYNVEGSRQGRKWYGLRLGFFTDPNAATQVAYYVRSDYPTVAVVPVAEKERGRADGGDAGKAGAAPAALQAPRQKLEDGSKLQQENLHGFELLEDDRPAPAKRDVGDVPASVPTVQAAAKPAARVPGKATGKPAGKRVMVRKPAGPPGAATPLEQTLEILGASTLTLDESREIINDSAVRSPVVKKKAGRFAKLLNRLGG